MGGTMNNKIFIWMGILIILIIVIMNTVKLVSSQQPVSIDNAKTKDYIANKLDVDVKNIKINDVYKKSFTITNPNIIQIEFEVKGETKTLLINKKKVLQKLV